MRFCVIFFSINEKKNTKKINKKFHQTLNETLSQSKRKHGRVKWQSKRHLIGPSPEHDSFIFRSSSSPTNSLEKTRR
jgi:hypothetical protein